MTNFVKKRLEVHVQTLQRAAQSSTAAPKGKQTDLRVGTRMRKPRTGPHTIVTGTGSRTLGKTDRLFMDSGKTRKYDKVVNIHQEYRMVI
jgi:hypothetical protein